MKLIKYSTFLPLLSLLSFTAGIMFSNQTYSSFESFSDVAMRYFPKEATSEVRVVVEKRYTDASLDEETRELFFKYPKQFLNFLNELNRITGLKDFNRGSYYSALLTSKFRFFINEALLMPEIEQEAIRSFALYQGTLNSHDIMVRIISDDKTMSYEIVNKLTTELYRLSLEQGSSKKTSLVGEAKAQKNNRESFKRTARKAENKTFKR